VLAGGLDDDAHQRRKRAQQEGEHLAEALAEIVDQVFLPLVRPR
jgi:hypothetical protein